MEQEIHYLNNYFDNSKLIINKEMQIFLYYLIKSIFIKVKKTSKQNKINRKLQTWIEGINKNLIMNKKD